MTDDIFHAVVRRDGGPVTIDMMGEINAFAEDALNAAYSEASASSPEALVLNFNAVSYINSTGIALIVSLLAQARKAGCRLLVYGLTDHYRELFQITRLSDFMELLPDEQSAIARAAGPSA